MNDYEIRIEFRDGTFAIVTIASDSIGDALDRATRGLHSVSSVTVLATIDRSPQVVLAFPGTASERIRAARLASGV